MGGNSIQDLLNIVGKDSQDNLTQDIGKAINYISNDIPMVLIYELIPGSQLFHNTLAIGYNKKTSNFILLDPDPKKGAQPKTFHFNINFPNIQNTYKNKDLPFNLKIIVSTKYNFLISKEIVMRF